jgi:hypothetical protein
MADEIIKNNIRQFKANLSPDQLDKLNNLNAETAKLETNSELKALRKELENLKQLEANSRYGIDPPDYTDEIAQAKRAIAPLEKARNDAREQWRNSLEEGQKANLQRLGADINRAEKGLSSTDPIIEEEARDFYKQSFGTQQWSQDLGTAAERKNPTIEFTTKDGESHAVILDSDGKELGNIKYDPSDAKSVEKAADQALKLGPKDYPGERVMFAFQIAGLLLFTIDAANTINDMKDSNFACQMLKEYANAVKDDEWGVLWARILKWMNDTTGPFAKLGGYIAYHQSGLYANKLDDALQKQLGPPGSTERNRLYRKLFAAANNACRSIKPKKHASVPNRKPLWLAAGAALLIAVGTTAVFMRGSGSVYSVNCDCDNVDFGLLTAEYRKECMSCEQNLLDLTKGARSEKDVVRILQLKADSSGKIVSGTTCNCPAVGPNAWPVIGGPIVRPPGLPEGVGTAAPKPNPSGLDRDVPNK